MPMTTEANIKEIKTAVEANTKAISDLTSLIREGFAHIDTKFADLRGDIKVLDVKLEERTKLGFWGFIFRGVALAFCAALTAIFVKYLFPVLPSELPRL
jgi:hypothetical protein